MKFPCVLLIVGVALAGCYAIPSPDSGRVLVRVIRASASSSSGASSFAGAGSMSGSGSYGGSMGGAGQAQTMPQGSSSHGPGQSSSSTSSSSSYPGMTGSSGSPSAQPGGNYGGCSNGACFSGSSSSSSSPGPQLGGPGGPGFGGPFAVPGGFAGGPTPFAGQSPDFLSFLHQYIGFLQQLAQQVQQQQQQQQQQQPVQPYQPNFSGSNTLDVPSSSGPGCVTCGGPTGSSPTGPSGPSAYGGGGLPLSPYPSFQSVPQFGSPFPSYPSFAQPSFGTYGTPFSAPAPGMGAFGGFPTGFGSTGSGSFGGSSSGGSSGPSVAQASATFGPQGGYGNAEVGDQPAITARQGGPFTAPSGAGSFGTFSSVSTGSSTVDGKTTSFKEAISGVNDNGKITTFVARDPPK